MEIFRTIGVLALALLATAAAAADYPAPRQGEWIAHDFKFPYTWQSTVGFQIGENSQVIAPPADEVFQAGVFARKFLEALFVVENLRLAQSRFDFRQAALELLDVGTQVHCL